MEKLYTVASCIDGRPDYRNAKTNRGCFDRKILKDKPCFCPSCGHALFYERVPFNKIGVQKIAKESIESLIKHKRRKKNESNFIG